jgi:hypothetical protein
LADLTTFQLGGADATLTIFKPLAQQAKLGYVHPVGRNSALDQTYSALDPSDAVDPTPDTPVTQTAPPDVSQVQSPGAPDGGGDGGGTGTGDGSGDGGTGTGDGTGDGGSGTGSGDGSGDGGGVGDGSGGAF